MSGRAAKYFARFTGSNASASELMSMAASSAEELWQQMPRNLSRLMAKAQRAERKEIHRRELSKAKREAQQARHTDPHMAPN